MKDAGNLQMTLVYASYSVPQNPTKVPNIPLYIVVSRCCTIIVWLRDIVGTFTGSTKFIIDSFRIQSSIKCVYCLHVLFLHEGKVHRYCADKEQKTDVFAPDENTQGFWQDYYFSAKTFVSKNLDVIVPLHKYFEKANNYF